jgi:hypothetical protein
MNNTTSSNRFVVKAFGAFTLLVSTALVPSSTYALTNFVDWNGGTTGSTQTGALGGVGVTLTGLSTSASISNFNLSGSNFSAAPGSSSQETANYQQGNDWTVNFASPVTNPLVYVVFWRPGSTYAFDQTPTILSGIPPATLSGKAFTPTASFTSGIFQFTGTFSSLQVTDSVVNPLSFQAVTFGVATPVPFEFSPVMGLGILGAGFAVKKLVKNWENKP